MQFEVILNFPSSKRQTRSEKPQQKSKSKWEELGIHVSKYMRHPTCPFCGLQDLGKEAPVRPTRNHMLSCQSRKLDPYPVTRRHFTDEMGRQLEEYEEIGRQGAFVGEAIPKQMRFPVRLIRPIETPILDENGEPTGQVDRRFTCSYQWKTEDGYDWVWNGERWVEWYNWAQ